MLLSICIWFFLLKRPIYESVLVSLIVLIIFTGSFSNVWDYVIDGMNSSLLFSMITFIAMSQLLKKTGILDDCIKIIIAIFGRITGGAGYCAIFASAFMGAFSGSGPGNVMAVGSITIPAMKKSGFSPELAANIQASSSCLGNMIPPSANIIGALGAYAAVYKDSNITTGKFWIIMWCLSLYFILLRVLMVYFSCKINKVEPINDCEIPKLSSVIKKGWKGLLLPTIILVPFLFDSLLNGTFLIERLGEKGAKAFSNSVLMFAASVTCAYALLVTKNKECKNVNHIVDTFITGIKGLVPTVSTCIFGYIIGSLFAGLGASSELEAFIVGLNLNKLEMAIVISFLTCFLGMVIPGSSLTVMFGTVFITSMASSGINPLIAAAMLPCICGSMGNITPPFALCTYSSIGIAEADIKKTLKQSLIWVLTQFVLQVLILVGVIPVIGV